MLLAAKNQLAQSYVSGQGPSSKGRVLTQDELRHMPPYDKAMYWCDRIDTMPYLLGRGDRCLGRGVLLSRRGA